MKPPPFKYLAPKTLEGALDAISQHGDEGKILAGGQSLIPAMNFRLMAPALLIDMNPVHELAYIRPSDTGGVLIGAMTRQSALEKDPIVADRVPLLHETVPYIAHPQIRNRGTVGGSLVHADPAAELPVISLTLDVRFRARSTRGDRWIQASEFFQFMFTTALEPDEILVEVEFPPMPPSSGWSFMEFSRRRGDYALAGVAAVVQIDGNGICRSARLVYLNLGDGPVAATEAADMLVGQAPSSQGFAAAAEHAAQNEVDPLGSVHATPEFQRHLAAVLTKRALQQAFERANGMANGS